MDTTSNAATLFVLRKAKMRELAALNKKQLQALCREKGIPVSNNNTDMRNRLLYK